MAAGDDERWDELSVVLRSVTGYNACLTRGRSWQPPLSVLEEHSVTSVRGCIPLAIICLSLVGATSLTAQDNLSWERFVNDLPKALGLQEHLPRHLAEMYFVDDTTGFITTHDGGVIRTDDGGLSWRLLYESSTDFGPHYFFLNKNVWFGGEGATHFEGFGRTLDAGKHWQTFDQTGTGCYDTKDGSGVLDFLIEALDEWYAAKNRGEAVPRHELCLDVFSGASAGGMCAAIAAAMVQGEFQHIHDTSLVGTSNRFYESWVNKIDIRELLQTRDLANRGPVYSLLDCTIIDEIAQYALVPGAPKNRPYISPNLTLFLTLTNLIGIPYSLNDVGSGSLEESTLYHADRLCFETVQPGQSPSTPSAKPLPLGQVGRGAWPLLTEAAKATGAFPIFLAPRLLKRDCADYERPMWESINAPADGYPPIPPDWPTTIGTTIQTINVDGGVIDNDPFDLAHDYLASLDPPRTDNQNPREPLKAERAVVTVAPFPSQSDFTPAPVFAQEAAVAVSLSRLVSVFISQSRFFGESLALIASGTSSRFVVAPSDTSLPAGAPALQCASLGAFGGFFERSFRAHDFQLGRRNCQQFLRYQFALPTGNPIIQAGLSALGAQSVEAQARFKVKAPEDATSELKADWIPIIPLCSDAVREDVNEPPQGKISIASLNEIVDLIDARLGAVLPLLLRDVPSEPLRLCLEGAAKLVELFGKGKMKEYLISQLGGCVG